MDNPYTGEIRMFGGDYAPAGWELCHGQLLGIALYEQLFSVIGTTYGGDGQQTFALPDLRGRVPISAGTRPGGSTRSPGQRGGAEEVTLGPPHLAGHTHELLTSREDADAADPHQKVLARSTTDVRPYRDVDARPGTDMPEDAVTWQGYSQPHENRQPYVAINFIICVEGLHPGAG